MFYDGIKYKVFLLTEAWDPGPYRNNNMTMQFLTGILRSIFPFNIARPALPTVPAYQNLLWKPAAPHPLNPPGDESVREFCPSQSALEL